MKLGHPLLFRANASCSKLLNVKSIFNAVKIFRATLFCRASASCSKILNDKKYFNTVKNSRETLPFRASASCSKLLNVCCENFQGNSVFSGQAQVAPKSWMIKNTYSILWKNSRETLFFRASTTCSKFWMWKVCSIQWKNSGQTLFFRESASCSKILNNEKYIQYSKKFQGKLFSGQSQVVKNPKCKKYIQYSDKFQGNSVFSGQAQVAQKSWTVKIFSIQCIFTWKPSVYFGLV